MADRSIAVRLRAEVSQFNADMRAAGQAAADAAKKTETSWSKSTSSVGKLAGKIQQNADAMETVGAAATGAGAAILGIGAAIAKTGISYNTLQQTSRAALATVLGSAQKANQQMDKLDEFARNSPFAKDVFIKAQQQMLAFGIEAEQVVPILGAVQDAVAAAGGSNQQIEEVVATLSKMSSTGKITAQDLNELGNRGINAAELIGVAMGKTGAQIREDITAQAITADEAIFALTEGMNTRFSGAAANVKNTLPGAFDRVKAAWRDLSADLMEPLVGSEGGGALITLTNGVADAMRAFQALPDPVKNATAALGGITGVGLTAGGTFLMLAPRLVETQEAVKQLQKSFPRATGALGKLSKAAAISAGAMALVQVAAIAYNAAAKDAAVEGGQAITNALLKAAKAADASSEAFDGMFQTETGGNLVRNVNDLGSAIDDLMYKGEPLNRWINESLGGDALNDMLGTTSEVVKQFREMDSALSQLTSSGRADEAAAAFDKIAASFEAQGYSAEQAAEKFPEYRDALMATANELGVTDLSNRDYIEWMRGNVPAAIDEAVAAEGRHAEGLAGVSAAAGETAASLDEVLQKLNALSGLFISSEEAQIAYEERLDSITEAIRENGASLDITTEAGRKNRAELVGLAEDGLALVEAQARMGESEKTLQSHMQATYDDLVATATQMGMNQAEAEEYARDLLGIPDDVPTDVYIKDYAKAVREAAAVESAVDSIPSSKTIRINFNVTEPENGIYNMPENLLNPGRKSSFPAPSQRMPRALGGIDFFAAGGFSQMSNIAQMVPPNTWRVVGDRSDVPEAFIPLDGSPRSISILMEAIRSMPGFGGTMASGGTTGKGVPAPDTTPVTDVWSAMFAELTAEAQTGWREQAQVWDQSLTGMGASTTTHLKGMESAQAQSHATRRKDTTSHLAAENQATTLGYQQMLGTVTMHLSSMRSTNATEWSTMQTSQASHLSTMRGDASSQFAAIRSLGIDNISAMSRGIIGKMDATEPPFRGELNDLIDTLGKFSASVNDAFKDVGVKLPTPQRFATGGTFGVLPGYSPGVDNHHFRSATGGDLYLSGGESIMRPEFTRMVGGERGIKELNQAARRGDGDTVHHMLGFKSGGVFPAIPGVNAFADAGVWRGLWGLVKAQFPQARLTSAYRGGSITASGNRSYHSQGRAVDLAGRFPMDTKTMGQIAGWLLGNYPGSNEIIYSPLGGRQIKNGRPYMYGGAVRRMHFNHVHWANRSVPGAGAGGPVPYLDDYGMPVSHPFLDGTGISAGSNAEAAYKRAAKAKLSKIIAEQSKALAGNSLMYQLGTGIMRATQDSLVEKAGEYGKKLGSGDFGGVANGPVKQMARDMLDQLGWGDQWGDLEWLVQKESSWNPNAQNPSSTAYGLFQFLNSTWGTVGGSKTSDPKKQLEYGLKYIKQRYGDVRGARRFWERNRWYADGTPNARSGLAVVGENGPELISLRGGEKILNAEKTRAAMAANRTFIQPSTGPDLDGLSKAVASALREYPQIVQNNDLASVAESRMSDRIVRDLRRAEALRVGV